VFTRRHIVSAASLKKWDRRAHFNTMCFSFAGKTMAADANQLQDLREFLKVDSSTSYCSGNRNNTTCEGAAEKRTRTSRTHSSPWLHGV